MKRFSLFVLVLLLIGCTNDVSHDEQLVGRLPIKINFEKSRANDTAFENGDQIGLYVVNYDGSTAGTLTSTENHVNNACFTLSTHWRADEELYWKDTSTKADIYAYSPYGNPTDVSAYQFSVKTDQSAEANYWLSDFLWGKCAGVTPTKNAVTIATEHILSNAFVYIKAGEGYSEAELAAADIEVKICNVKNLAVINLANGVATAMGSVAEITPWNTGTYYRAMIVPQTVSGDKNLVLVKINNKEYSFATDITFVAGTQHKIEVTISAPSNGLTVNFSIKEWNVDDTIYEGEAIINPETTPMPANNEIWYTATAKIEPSEVDEIDANIISNEWDSTTKKGVITFDGDITKIGDWAFAIEEDDYAPLVSITIPKSVNWIGNNSFAGCDNLEAFYGSIASLDNRCLIINGALVAFARAGLTEYTTPTGVVSITNGAFYFCESLKKVTISEGVTTLGYTAFYSSSIESIVLPESLTSIGYLSFGYCTLLREIIIPSNVTSIEEGAFYACNSLEEIYCKSTIPPFLGEFNFYYEEEGEGKGIPLNCPIYVPSTALNSYKNNMFWELFVNNIIGYDF